MDATDGFGADCGVEAVGYQAHDASGQEHPELVMDNLVNAVRATGRIRVVGVYVPTDRPQGPPRPPRKDASASSGEPPSRRASPSEPASARSSATTGTFAT